MVGVYVCGKGSGFSQSALVLGLSPLETHPDLLVHPVTQLSASPILFSSVSSCGVGGALKPWGRSQITYRSWRKGRGFTGMNCDKDVSWSVYLNMAVESGPTHTHDGQAAGCLGEWVLQQKRRRPVSSVRRFCQLLGLSRATGRQAAAVRASWVLGGRGPTRLAAK